MQSIFEQSRRGGRTAVRAALSGEDLSDLPVRFLRKSSAGLPEVTELQAVKHYTCLSRRNLSSDTGLNSLASCTFNYHPGAALALASLPEFLVRHPEAPEGHSQGFMACVYDLQELIKAVTGMPGASLAPAAGAQCEFAGIAMIKAYHDARNDADRTEILIPETAQAAAAVPAEMCGYSVRKLPVGSEGSVDVAILENFLGSRTAGLMLTNPSTVAVFACNTEAIAGLVHEAGGLLNCTGDNLSAIAGKNRPDDMGIDVITLDLHKCFCAPRGGGGPGAGAVAVSERLLPYLPAPMVDREGDAYTWLDEQRRPESVGRFSAFAGNAGILLRAYIAALMLGRKGMRRAAEYSTMNASYLRRQLLKSGFDAAYPERGVAHEVILNLCCPTGEGVATRDYAKRLLDYGVHVPTTLLPPQATECLLLEPTGAESKEMLDSFVAAMRAIRDEAETDPDTVRGAPYTMPVGRLDEGALVDADLTWKPTNG
ncbi:MAG: aminomethyl-transferring glycine dehydrogenase subunit GcvPB [Chromatiaceae bacterium]|nr:aminomethyl-transferring glycine dehydrogenase subunit GcvPB [Chromatiaceae bacterium]